MATSPTKLSLLTFPQHWDGASLRLRVLVIPREDPLAPLVSNVPPGVDAPAFAKARLALNAHVIPSLAMLPRPMDVTVTRGLTTARPAQAEDLFNALAVSFSITKPSNVVRTLQPNTYTQKYLALSYRHSFAFSHPRTPYAKIDDSYSCAFKEQTKGLPPPQLSDDEVSWGKVFALALRQPALAEELGFIYEDTIPLPANTLNDGGWVYVDLDPSSDFAAQVSAQPAILKRYAARIPALSTDRALFAAVQFPVSDVPVNGNFDPVFVEAENYDDGFANIVHCVQPTSANLLLEPHEKDRGLPPVRDIGIRLAWDDEQILIWHNRQMVPDPLVGDLLDSPLGVLSYRVDMRPGGEDDDSWNSLSKVEGDLILRGIDLGHFDGELGVEVAPVQLDGQRQGVYWLPPYFAQWAGASLVLKDLRAAKLAGTDHLVRRQMEAVDEDAVQLRYGLTYDFRVRLADITGGGPKEKDRPVYDAPAPVATCRFRRHVPPHLVRIPEQAEEPGAEPRLSHTIHRPRLGHPTLMFTQLPDPFALLEADRPAALAEQREIGHPDPDAAHLRIDVDVTAPELDTLLAPDIGEAYYALYSVTRSFPDDETLPFELELEFHDAPVVKFGDAADLGDLPLTGDDDPLALPRGRDIRIRVTAVCREDPDLEYFGSQEARIGKSVSIHTRAEPRDERNLFLDDVPGRLFRGMLLQPDAHPTPQLEAVMALSGRKTETPASVMQRIADQLQLDTDGLTLMGKPGKRLVFGCSKAVAHMLAPDRGSITFASKAELTERWLAVITLQLQRDWSWDALETISFEIRRDGADLTGTVDVPRTVPITALRMPDRSHSTIVFIDAVDPKVFPGQFPTPAELRYSVETRFKTPPVRQDPVRKVRLTVPVAVPPAQVPKVTSAGIALSPYERTDDYAATRDRRRVLWLEFDEPVHDPQDDYFGFVKAYAADPLLVPGRQPAGDDPKEAIPFLPPESIRVITPGQSDDRAGLNAWQRLIPCSEVSPRHFIVPLPPGMNAESPELFGFFVYEFCVGHARVWSTAQARFGRAIRLTGVQHSAPVLVCTVERTTAAVLAYAPFAQPVSEGRPLLDGAPETELWGVLYTQVVQADGNDHRNILLGERRMRSPERGRKFATNAIPVTGTMGQCGWSQGEIESMLRSLRLPPNSPLSIVAVEMFSNFESVGQPLSADLGTQRIYRTSRLEPVPMIC